MPISIYPPTLQSTQPAFLQTVNEYIVNFTLQSITSFDEIGHVQIRVVKQSNNRTIANIQKYPDGTIYKRPAEIRGKGSPYSIAILRDDLQENWQAGYLYKVQMRFGMTEMFSDVSSFADWKKEQIDNQTFSEWSTVMIIKAISQPEVEIQNAEAVDKENLVATQRTEATLTPLFVGVYKIDEVSKELVDKYRFTLYEDREAEDGEEIETSGWLQHNSLVNNTDSHRFQTILTNGESYTVEYEIQTVNGYYQKAQPYSFFASRTYLAELEGFSIRVDSQDSYCNENGCINIYLTSKEESSGSYLITRSSEKSNYQVWEDLKYITWSNRVFDNTLIYQDFTVESGVNYKYAFQMENAEGLRTSPIYPERNIPHGVDFEFSYLYRDGIQLKLKFNNKVNTFKHTVLASKQDTLGDKYPHLSRNGYAYYAEFPITGLISLQMDDDKTFTEVGSDGLLYNGELIVPERKFERDFLDRLPCADGVDTTGSASETVTDNNLTVDSSLSNNNIYIERKFREKVEEFLNDFTYKLYKSPTEGNIVVGLMNVSLTPNATLGRMIFEFSATAYEVLENTLDNLNEVGIINIGSFMTLASEEPYYTFGQLAGVYTAGSPRDIYDEIKKQEEISIGGGYKMHLEEIRSLWIEGYPMQSFSAELLELQAQKAILQSKEEDTSEIDAVIQEYEKIQEILSTSAPNVIKLSVNGKEIIASPNRIYSLREPVRDLQVLSTSLPIIVNYSCKLTQKEDLSVGVISAIDASRIWGQISGIFTPTESVLKVYNYDYGPGESPYRVYNRMPDASVIYDYYGNRLVDNTNFNVYKTINLYEVIKEETRHQVEYIYAIKDGFYQDENGDWTNGTIYYNFSDIIEFDIEADPGAKLLIGKAADGSDAKEILIGPTGRYILSPINDLIRYIVLQEPQFAIINYKCLTNQMRIKRRG